MIQSLCSYPQAFSHFWHLCIAGDPFMYFDDALITYNFLLYSSRGKSTIYYKAS